MLPSFMKGFTVNTRVFDAPTEQQGPVPAYKVQEIEGPFLRQRTIFDEKSQKLVKQDYTVDKAYLVLFPRGHSIVLDTLEALEEHGFGEVVPLINMAGEAEMNEEHTGRSRTTRRSIQRDDD